MRRNEGILKETNRHMKQVTPWLSNEIRTKMYERKQVRNLRTATSAMACAFDDVILFASRCYISIIYSLSCGASAVQPIQRLPMGWTTEGLQFQYVKSRILSSPHCQDRSLVPPRTAMVNGGAFTGVWRPRREAGRHLELMPRARKRELIHRIPHTSSWRIA
jgi:hypothetical protein